MYSVYLKPLFFLVKFRIYCFYKHCINFLFKYRVFTLLFCVTPTIVHCAGDDTHQATLNEIHLDILNLKTTLNSHIANNSAVISETNSRFKLLESKMSDFSATDIDTLSLVNELKLTILPHLSRSLTTLSTNAQNLLTMSSTNQEQVLRGALNIQVHIDAASRTFQALLNNLAELRIKSNMVQQLGKQINTNVDSIGGTADLFHVTTKELIKLVSDFKMDFSKVQLILREGTKSFYDTKIEFENLSDKFHLNFQTTLDELSFKMTTPLKDYMKLTGRFKDLELSLKDSTSQVNLPKEFHFDSTAVVNHLTECDNLDKLKMDYSTLVQSSSFKSQLRQAVAEIDGIENSDAVTDLLVQVTGSFSLN